MGSQCAVAIEALQQRELTKARDTSTANTAGGALPGGSVEGPVALVSASASLGIPGAVSRARSRGQRLCVHLIGPRSERCSV